MERGWIEAFEQRLEAEPELAPGQRAVAPRVAAAAAPRTVDGPPRRAARRPVREHATPTASR